jgi:transposase-like protein
MLTVVPDDCPDQPGACGGSLSLIDEIVREGARRMLAEQRAFAQRDLSGVDYVFLRADGIHVNTRPEEHKLCLLVMIGVRADGKELIVLTDGYLESAEWWADLLRDCARRGMGAPVLAAGDGALGFWGALLEVFPQTTEQRCWSRKTANVLAVLPKPAYPGAKKALAEIWDAEDKDHARAAAKAFEGPSSRAAGPAMAFKLIRAAQDRWRAVNAPHLVALVRAGAHFERGVLVERSETTAA